MSYPHGGSGRIFGLPSLLNLIIIADIRMPRKNGLEMMKGIKIHHPIIKTIDMSGNIGSFEPFLKTLLLESLIWVVTDPAFNYLIRHAATVVHSEGIVW